MSTAVISKQRPRTSQNSWLGLRVRSSLACIVFVSGTNPKLFSSEFSVDPCTQDQEAGVGSVQLTRFYFNKQTKLCEEFMYFGAGGNRNNFLTLEECQAQCPGSELHGRSCIQHFSFRSSGGGLSEDVGICYGAAWLSSLLQRIISTIQCFSSSRM